MRAVPVRKNGRIPRPLRALAGALLGIVLATLTWIVGIERRIGHAQAHRLGAAVGDQAARIERRVPAERLPGARTAVAHYVRGCEIIGDAAPLIVGGSADQPQQQEERHHRGDEVGVRDLPAAAVGTSLDDLLTFDDDRAAALAFPA